MRVFNPLCLWDTTAAYRCGLQILLLVFSLLGSMSAAAFTKTWNPFGYSNYAVVNYPYTTAPPVYASKQAFCEGYLPLIGASVSNVCYESSVGDYCVPKGFPCIAQDGSPNAWSYSDTAISPQPVCTYANVGADRPVIDTRPPRPRSVRANVGWSGSASVCGCINSDLQLIPDVIPDLNTGWCYDPFGLDYVISTTRYTPSTAKTPVALTVIVRRSYELAPNTPITLRVTSADGTPGTITPASGVTDANGELTASYTFPQFDKKQVDVIEIGCDSCMFNPTHVNITMAPTVVGFFNGVWNTRKQATDGLAALTTATDAVRDSISVRYELFYNQTGCGHVGTTCLQDLAEVFIQRSQQLDGVLSNRWEHFWDLVGGRHTAPQSSTGGLLGLLGNASTALVQLLDSIFNALLAQVFAGYAQMLSSPPTGADMATHISKLQAYADQDYSFVLIAHSQGNLFVNTAYDNLRSSRPNSSAKVVHIAPASPTTRGDYVLADIDLVINGLRVQGITSVPSANISLPTSRADASGHTLVGTYLDASRAALGWVQNMIKAAIAAL